MIKDVIADVLWKNPIASNIISLSLNKSASDDDQNQINVNVFRYKQSLDDPTLIFWRPSIANGEWPFIYVFKLVEGKVVVNTDLGSPI